MSSLSQSVLACSHRTVLDRISGDTHRHPNPLALSNLVFGPALTLPASKHTPSFDASPRTRFAYMPGAFPTGKVPRAAGQTGTARPKAELLAGWKGALRYGSWGKQRKNRPIGMASWGPFKPFLYWGPGQSQKGIYNRILPVCLSACHGHTQSLSLSSPGNCCSPASTSLKFLGSDVLLSYAKTVLASPLDPGLC